MKTAFATWMWSLRVVARSYRTVVVLAALVALWVFAAYEWLGLPESSGSMLLLTSIWALVQLFATALILGGTVLDTAAVASTETDRLNVMDLFGIWISYRNRLFDALLFCLLSCVAAGTLWGAFGWINDHSVEVASFLTFHSEKPVSYVLIGKIYRVVEGLVWIALSGFLLNFFAALVLGGWRRAGLRAAKILAACIFRTPFLTGVLSVAVFGGVAYLLGNWHPVLPPGFWDYTQMTVRFSLIAILLAAGWFFWLLSLARLSISVVAPPMTIESEPS